MARWWVGTGPSVLFPERKRGLNFVSEQFWGRAARAPADSKESGRLFNFWTTAVPSCPLRVPQPLTLPQRTSSMTCVECVSEPELEVAVTVMA